MSNHCVEIRAGEQNGFLVSYGPLEVWFARINNARKFAIGLADGCAIAIFDCAGNLKECFEPKDCPGSIGAAAVA